MEEYLEDKRPSLEEVCNEYEKCTEECPAYGFCHSKTESDKEASSASGNCYR